MTTRGDIRKRRLVYSCNCGWLDLGHANARSRRKYVGAESLWNQVMHERVEKNQKVEQSKYEPGYRVVYKQDMAGFGMRAGETGRYLVRPNLSIKQKESVALAIFMEISLRFEGMQDSWPYSWATDSGFSVEDLVSNLIGFYATIRPGTDYLRLCQPVSIQASEAVWDNHGNPGNTKNRAFEPKFYPCADCKKKGAFPTQLQEVRPAAIVVIPSRWQEKPKKLGKGQLVRRWSNYWDSLGAKATERMIEVQEEWKDHHQD